MAQRDFNTAAQRLAAVVESSDDAIVSKDLDGNVVTWNPAAERMVGYTAADMVGRSIRLIIPPDRQCEEDNVLARIRRGESVAHFETLRLCKDGTSLHLSKPIDPRDLLSAVSQLAKKSLGPFSFSEVSNTFESNVSRAWWTRARP